ncbi:MAG: hypothetical protein EBT12_01920 [Marivivens sp.]|nr:hypothetical protein [Marivivens sp.]
MTVNSQRLLLAAAGAAAAGEGLYVDDVFSTFLYEPTGSAQTITNGIDLDGEGGLLWIKPRDANHHLLWDTERGISKNINSSNANAETTASSGYGITSFNSDGFSLGLNYNGENYSGFTSGICSWTFRKAPGFFDVVTYTGNGTAGRTVAHNLGSVPGCIIIKEIDGTEDWRVYHRSLGATKNLRLNQNYAAGTNIPIFNDTEPTSTVFTVGTDPATNGNNKNFVAYIFAHDDQSFGEDEDESIIKCGTFTTDGSYNGTVTLGWEPQWVMVKNSSATGGWFIHDVMRGAPVSGDNNWLYANTNGAETTSSVAIRPNPTGFTSFNHSASTDMIYIAIRRPHKPPEAGTDVFAIDTLGGTSPTPPGWTSGFPVDWEFIHKDNVTSQWGSITRLTMKLLYLNLTNTESSINSNDTFDHMTGWSDNTGPNANNFSWMFRRAPGFFDVVAYSGTGAAQNVNHNLEVTPELMIVKSRSAGNWNVYSSATGATKYLNFNGTIAAATSSSRWNDTAPTSSVFTAGTTTSISGETGDWYVYDSTRGIVGGNDPYLLINSTAAEVTNTDYIDPLNSGFTVTSSAPAGLNASGGTYIFLAIA